MSSGVDRRLLRRLVEGAKKKRKNRLYYKRYFNISDVKQAGIIQAEERATLDRLTLDLNRNESIHLFGFDQNGSYFNLEITIVSLYPNSNRPHTEESSWRFAQLEFVYLNEEKKCKYSYKCEELLDYEKRRHEQENKHQSRNLLKIGSLSLETVSPFALTRLLLTGLVNYEKPDDNDNDNDEEKKSQSSGQFQTIPIRLSISSHPTCDKFDYKFLFSKKHLMSVLERSASERPPADSLDLLLEDRFDQPMMFQGHLERLKTINDNDGVHQPEEFIMWGAKSKKFLETNKALKEAAASSSSSSSIARENLFIWAESGQQIHLSRPLNSNVINGMVHNAYDYPSAVINVELASDEEAREVPLNAVKCFRDLTCNHQIKLIAFKTKKYCVQFASSFDDRTNQPGILKTKINGFDGFALVVEDNLERRLREAQAKLWTLTIGDPLVTLKLAEERLLGGKGYSLVDLARRECLTSTCYDNKTRIDVSVPRGLIVSCMAYKLWLESDANILRALEQLDWKRRALSARSIYLNPMSSKYLSSLRAQQILKEECKRTCSLLTACPLPAKLMEHIRGELLAVFGEQELQSNKLFAVRSSAVGEDSLETSAAGQMRTILDARGLDAICKSIVDCWSSQFELEALTYKSQNGLAFNLPMAVVVQELIECQVAGVGATCDPLNGNKRQLEITANLGLGEGVVSGKQTDTIRVSLGSLEWSSSREDHLGLLSLEGVQENDVEKLTPNGSVCCLDDRQIISLANVLVKLRQISSIKEREVEWGITTSKVDANQSSSSSSSSSSDNDDQEQQDFRIHLLQSRPLTHLQRLAAKEVEHELDFGIASPMDIVTRANLGEVMPGALSPMNATYYQTITTSFATHKPFQANHTRCPYVADSFAFRSGMAMMVVSYSDTVARFSGFPESDGDGELAKAAIYSMIGSTFDQPKDESAREKLESFYREKVNPNSRIRRKGLAHLLRLDLGFLPGRLSLELSLKSMGHLKETEKFLDQTIESTFDGSQRLNERQLIELVQKLYQRLMTETELMSKSWMLHIGATIVSMSFNVMCLKLLSSQPAYAGMDLICPQILNDFSTLMGGGARSNTLGEQTESGDISLLLNRLLDTFLKEQQLDQVRALNQQELYDYLTDPQCKWQSCKVFRDFIGRNGHRAYKEFCMATRTWSDDCSYIIRLLSMRLKTFNGEEATRELKRREELASEHQKRLGLVEAKVERTRFLLLKYAIPKAQQATIRRERSKSLTIEVVHKFRLALRQLGGLLCLLGRLPSAELIYFLSIQELDEIIEALKGDQDNDDVDDHQRRAHLSRLIYKARRRQQMMRTFDKVKFPKPTMGFHEMVGTIREQVAQSSGGARASATGGVSSNERQANNSNGTAPQQQQQQQAKVKVKGLTSCGGRVTGRACVVGSLEEMDQIQENDILVTYSIDICWSVYFFALTGIVTEVGGIVSHGAVVAREYGIPTLCTAVGACSAFKTGQLITLDADQGVCYLADEGEAAPDEAV